MIEQPESKIENPYLLCRIELQQYWTSYRGLVNMSKILTKSRYLVLPSWVPALILAPLLVNVHVHVDGWKFL